MKIKDMFAKKIDREIQGVIIVGQGEDANVSQELEEYVVTRELQKHFADFYSAYKKGIVGTTPKMGVWISGFFGSGKSHFLKILSYLLENRQVGDRKAMDYFVEDKKIVDPMVLADMKLAADTPTDVILFNIDSKSETNGKQNKDAIVNVFLKVFNQMQGFCGSIPHVADLERRLSEEGRYDEFKAAFEEEYGDPWEESRQDFDFIQDSVVDALVSMDFMSEAAARNWCEKAVEPYTISIEDFAKRVKNYIERKGNNHHVVFLVDEIGQYIGDDSKLMLNLQTVTEELGKECMGKAWVIVTSQQDMVNRVPCADMTIHRHAGGVFIDNGAFLFKNCLFLLFFGNHRDSHNSVTDFGKLLRHFELRHKLSQQIRRKRAEAVIRQTRDKEGIFLDGIRWDGGV